MKRYSIAEAAHRAMLLLSLAGFMLQSGPAQGVVVYPTLKVGSHNGHVCLFVKPSADVDTLRFQWKNNVLVSADINDCPDDPIHHTALCPDPAAAATDSTCVGSPQSTDLSSGNEQIKAADKALGQTLARVTTAKADLAALDKLIADKKDGVAGIQAGIAWLQNAVTAIVFVLLFSALIALGVWYLPRMSLFARYMKSLKLGEPKQSDPKKPVAAPTSPALAQSSDVATAIKSAEKFLFSLNNALRTLRYDPNTPKHGDGRDSASMTGTAAAQTEDMGLDKPSSAADSLNGATSNIPEIFEAILVLVKSAYDVRQSMAESESASSESELAAQESAPVAPQTELELSAASEQAAIAQTTTADVEFHKTLLSLKGLAEKIIATQRKHASEMTGMRKMLVALKEEIRSENRVVTAAFSQPNQHATLSLSAGTPVNAATAPDAISSPFPEMPETSRQRELPTSAEAPVVGTSAARSNLDFSPPGQLPVRTVGFETALESLAQALYGDHRKAVELDRMLRNELAQYPTRYTPRPNWPADVDADLAGKTMAALRIVRIDQLGSDPNIALTEFVQSLHSSSAGILNPRIGSLIDSRYHSRAERIGDAASNKIGAVRWAGLQIGDVVLMRAGIVDFVATG